MVSLWATLEPQGKLDPQPWLTSAATRAVMVALSAEGAAPRFVGGCVRDGLAKRPVKDIDIATPDAPEKVMTLAEAAGLKAIPTGIAHGTVTVVSDGVRYEVTTLRRDLETDGRHARVQYTDDWSEDAKRRDFTINALSANADGDVYDYFDGIPDLAHGRIRFVGRASERIEEDYLRILRYFRFHAHYGRPPADRNAVVACRQHAAQLERLSGERVRDEFLKILAADEPAEVMLLMRTNHVLEHVLAEAGDIGRLRMAAWLASRALTIEGVDPDPLRRLAALTRPDLTADEAAAVAGRFRLSNRDTDRLVAMATPPDDLDAVAQAPGRRHLLHRLGPETVRDAVMLAWASEMAIQPKLPAERTEGWRTWLEDCAAWQGPVFPLSGRDVMDLGVPSGPRVGDLLAQVEAWWQAGDFQASREDCLTELGRLL